jgi:peptidoglycan/LPS O-acetylase OafA/YrhL
MKSTEQNNNNRIPHLDALRGIAILLVLFFHAFARWPQIMPYGSQYQKLPLFSYGWLGVNLFFMISGFVILMTLEKCGSFPVFIKKRWLRLFPSMLIVSIIIIATAHFMTERPLGLPRVQDFFPGVTFIHPFFLERISGARVESLEGSFWSLYVEFGFYFIFGSLFFVLKNRALWVFSALSILGYIFFQISLYNFPNHLSAHICNDVFGFQNYPWFAAGAFAFKYYQQRDRASLSGMILLSFFSLFTIIRQNDMMLSICSLAVLAVFLVPIFSQKIRETLALNIFIFAGFISYPLYLIHENMLVSLTIKAGKHLSGVPGFLLPVIPILFLFTVAYFITKHAEPKLKKAIVRVTGK